MTITAVAVRDALRGWAVEQRRTLDSLRRALAIVYRQRPGGLSVDEMLERLLLSLAHAHELQVGARLDSLEGALGRLLDDMEALRHVAAEGRAPALRERDLHVIAEVLTRMSSFEDYVRLVLNEDAASLEGTMRGLVEPASPVATAVSTAADVVTAARREIPPLARSLGRGQQIKAWAAQILQAWRSGHTLEPLGRIPLDVPWPDNPTLVEVMRRMDAAIVAYDAVRHTDPARAARAVDRLRRAVAEANETLRAFGSRFDDVSTGHRIAPGRPAATRPTPPPGSAAASALADAEAAAARLAVAGMNSVPPGELFDAMHFAAVETAAEGVLGEPLSRRLQGVGLESALPTPGEIGRWPTRPPWLAARLASLMSGWERAHLIGPGFGGELFAGIMLAPWGVNQVAQNRGVEAFLRAAASLVDEVHVSATARGRQLVVPLANGAFESIDVLTSVHYEIPRPGQPPLHCDITVHPDGSWDVSHNLPAGAIGADVPLRGTR